MNKFTFDTALTEAQRNLVTITLRRNGLGAYRETDGTIEYLYTYATRAQLTLASPVRLPIQF